MTNSKSQLNFLTTTNINLNWDWQQNIGAGLKNLINTCYMNSVLQCLTYTAPLSNFLVTPEHHSTCTRKEFCLMCLMKKHVSLALNTNEVVVPKSFVSNLKQIVSHFNKGTQEDAHEFLQYVLEGMQSSSSSSNNVVNQIFGGSLRSRVQCLKCNAVSDTYEQCMCVQLDIKKAKSINQALEQFIDPEVLGGENGYKCSSCNDMSTAIKAYSIYQTPNVLTLSLKRFDIFSMNKICTKIQYPEFLNVQPYTSDGNPATYSLYAVLVHAGTSCNCGHYYCYVKAPNGEWYEMNDASVTKVNMKTVLNQQAYLLFYIRTENTTESCGISDPHPSISTKRPRSETLSPVQPPSKKQKKSYSNKAVRSVSDTTKKNLKRSLPDNTEDDTECVNDKAGKRRKRDRSISVERQQGSSVNLYSTSSGTCMGRKSKSRKDSVGKQTTKRSVLDTTKKNLKRSLPDNTEDDTDRMNERAGKRRKRDRSISVERQRGSSVNLRSTCCGKFMGKNQSKSGKESLGKQTRRKQTRRKQTRKRSRKKSKR